MNRFFILDFNFADYRELKNERGDKKQRQNENIHDRKT